MKLFFLRCKQLTWDENNYLIISFSLACQFPIGIDSDRFIRALDTSNVQNPIKDLQERFKGRKVFLLLCINCFCG